MAGFTIIRRLNCFATFRVFGWLCVLCCAANVYGQLNLRPASDYDLQGTTTYVDTQAGVVHVVEPGEAHANQPGGYIDANGQFINPQLLPAHSVMQQQHFGASPDCYEWQLLPLGAIYRPYLADTKASRLELLPLYEKDDDMFLDGTLGGRFGLIRYGSKNPIFPEGFQIDVEGSAQVRLDPGEFDLRSTDYRAGLPLTWGYNRWRTKLAYYHISAHAGDEFLLKNINTFQRINYVRDEILFGQSYFLNEDWRIYGEVGYAFHTDGGAEPLEFNFGVEYSPIQPVQIGSRTLGKQFPNGVVSGPFMAFHGNLREELNYSGNVTAQSGWQWRNMTNGQLLRMGGHIFSGLSNQYEFFSTYELQAGFGFWYDY